MKLILLALVVLSVYSSESHECKLIDDCISCTYGTDNCVFLSGKCVENKDNIKRVPDMCTFDEYQLFVDQVEIALIVLVGLVILFFTTSLMFCVCCCCCKKENVKRIFVPIRQRAPVPPPHGAMPPYVPMRTTGPLPPPGIPMMNQYY